MTTRLLIVGNSHVAALRMGWKKIEANHPDLQVTFFAANSTLFRQLEFKGMKFGIHNTRKYKARYSKFLLETFGRLTVDMADFDAVVLVGQNTHEVDFLRQFERFSIDGIRERPGKPRLSEEAFFEFCTGIAQKRIPPSEWHHWEETRLFQLPPPVPCENCPENSETYAPWARYGADGAGLDFLNLYRDKVRELYATLGITVLSPPPDVYADNGLTKIEFGNNAGKLSGDDDYQETDFHHMNAEYGARVLAHVIEEIAR